MIKDTVFTKKEYEYKYMTRKTIPPPVNLLPRPTSIELSLANLVHEAIFSNICIRARV